MDRRRRDDGFLRILRIAKQGELNL
jgi:hypothetical protein